MKSLLTLCLLISSIAYAEIQTPEEFSGIQDHQSLKIKIVEIFNGGIVDYGGIGDADFKLELQLESKVKGPTGRSLISLASEALLWESEIYEIAVGDIDREEKVISIPGKLINDHIRKFHHLTNEVKFIVRLYEDVPTAAGVASVFLPGDTILDRHIDLAFIKKEEMQSGHFEVLLSDSNTRRKIEVNKEVGLFGWGGTKKVTKSVGHFDSQSYVQLIFEVE